MVAYFEAIPGVAPLPRETNPASWMLDVAYAHRGAPAPSTPLAASDASLEAQPPMAARYVPSTLALTARRDADAAIDMVASSSTSSGTSPYGAPLWSQTASLALRFWRETIRGTEFTAMRVVLTLFLARALWEALVQPHLLFSAHTPPPPPPVTASVFFGLIWRDASTKAVDQGSALTLLGVMAAENIFMATVTFASALPIYSLHREAFYREKAASYYRPEAYVLSLLVVEIPWLALQALVYQAVSYPMVSRAVLASRHPTMYPTRCALRSASHGLLRPSSRRASRCSWPW